LRSLRCLRS